MKLIYIEWEDATAQSTWHTKEEVEEFIKSSNLVRQVGWVYKEDKEFLVLVSRQIDWVTSDTEYGHLQKIPKTWIRKRKDLTEYIQ
jgi:hypothetical protein